MRTKSKKPRKQRLYEYKISKHEAHKLMSSHLSRKLRSERGFRSLPVRVGDTVRIVRGDFKGKTGKVSRTDPRKQRVFIDGVIHKKTDNTEVAVPIHPSNLVIEKLYEKDRRRLEIINRRISDVEAKIDIDAVIAEAEEEESDLIELEDEEALDDVDIEDIEDEFEILDDEEVDDEETEEVEEQDEDSTEEEEES